MGATDDEPAWISQSQNGDDAAFEALVRLHQRTIHSLTFRMTGSLADAEDLSQETSIRAYKQLGACQGRARSSSRLYRIAVNACLNWLRRELRCNQAHNQWVESSVAVDIAEQTAAKTALRNAAVELASRLLPRLAR